MEKKKYLDVEDLEVSEFSADYKNSITGWPIDAETEN